MKRAAIYARVSTDDKGQDPLNQLLLLRPFAAKLGLEIVAEYVDEATGKNGDRDGFKAMMKAASRHKFDVLLFWALDRLTREGFWMTINYLHRLTANGIAYKSYTEQYIDSLGIFSDVVVGVLAVMAQQQRIRISEQTKAGLARIRACYIRDMKWDGDNLSDEQVHQLRTALRLGRPRVSSDKASRTTMWRRQREAA